MYLINNYKIIIIIFNRINNYPSRIIVSKIIDLRLDTNF